MHTRILGIESSCDETAAAVVDYEAGPLSSVVASQLDEHARYGGVVPELASREHLRAIVPVVRVAMREGGVGWSGLDAIAVTVGPGLVGSLLVGLTYAKALSFARNLPLIAVNHIEGHIHAVILEARLAGNPVELPALALIVSGGHTHLFEVSPDYHYKLLGRTRDDAAGEAFDKVGKLLGFSYPGGPLLDRIAKHGDPLAVRFSLARMKSHALDFSFSGLKTAVLRWVESRDLTSEIETRRQLFRNNPHPSFDEWLAATPQTTRDLIASFQHTVVTELVQHAASSAQQIHARSVIISGGVACNSGLRRAARLDVPVHFPSPALATDNAVMIAAAAFPKFARREFATLDEPPHANLPFPPKIKNMFLRAAATLLCASLSLFAAVDRIEVTERSPVLDGKTFGKTGPYQRITGKVYFTVDPKNPANRNIADIDLAPVNAKGLVEFSSDLYMLQPVDPSKGNGAVLFEISNRGGKGMLGFYDRASGGTDPRTAAQFGDGFLLEQGYTLVWVGWQFDVPRRPGLLRLYAPIATEHGKTITGLVRAEFTPDHKTNLMGLSDRNHVVYPMVTPGDLTVRDSITGPRTKIPADQWKIVDGKEISLPSGFEPGHLYEMVYTAKDPVLAGLGLAAVRDFTSYLKHEKEYAISRVYGFGVSQSGRFLRKFLYDGFNADEHNQKAFDGVLAHVAGAGLGSFNERFAQPSRDGHPFLNSLYPTDIAPFTDNDGLLARARKTNTVPRIFYSDSSYEYWGRSAALITTTPDGKKDEPLPDSTRMYFFAGGQHGPAPFPPPHLEAENASSPADYKWAMRALLEDMDRWVKDGTAPPLTDMKTLDRQLEESLVTERMIATLSSVFGVLATILAIIGLYGVMAYMVTRRSREIGIRMALGAMSGNVVWLVMRKVLVLVGAGVAVGLPAAYFLTKVVQAQLYGIEPNDPLSLALATLLLIFVSLAAGYIPARRAARFDPVRVLRYE